MSDDPIFAAPVLEYGIDGDPAREQPIVAIKTSFGAAAGIFTVDQLGDLAAQALAWASLGKQVHQARTTEPEWIVGRPIRTPNLALGPADEPENVVLIVPIGPLRLQFIVPKRVILGLVATLQRLDAMDIPKKN